MHVLPEIRSLLILLVAYTIPYLVVWSLVNRIKWLRPLDYLLTLVDIAGITACIYTDGERPKPFFLPVRHSSSGPSLQF